ncbi:serine hydrolase domain-containing protein [Bradyrhizobium prioriisuperbiae]|uniref:serine hydrolase domain-containing protein n=1 Tax=Bradyrhizobium prioriisuperbiae TaxID=2854389 RepID=UPI0028E1EF90|nr:serine hydrolase domain-containing protein [Bradyrhizobium prioritasuperba]
MLNDAKTLAHHISGTGHGLKPSRRAALTLLLGGSVAMVAGDADWCLAMAASDGLARSRPEDQGIAPRAILDFLDDVDRQGFELHSFMLWRNGHVVAEGWWSPYRADRVHMMHSLTKSVAVCAVGLAIAEGRFNLRDKVVSFFREHLPDTVDDKLAAMTVEDLLTMRTGHAHMVSGSVWRPIKTSWVAEFFKIPVVYQPGTKWVYTSAATYLLSAIVTKVTGQPLADYLKTRLFDPLGITGYQWPVGPENISPGANGLSWKTVDSLKLGILHAQNGRWNGKQVLPADWVAAVQSPHVKDTYGYQWWLGPDGAYYANGLFSQLSFVFPKHNAVLAITSGIPGGAGFTKLVFQHTPAMLSASVTAHSRDGKALAARTANLRLLPQPALSSSSVVPYVSAKKYQFPENADAIKSVSLTFADKGCRFVLEDDRGIHTIEVGLGQAVEGSTTMTGNKLHHEYQPDVMRVIASGAWRDTRTFVMIWVFVESAFRDTVECVFEGPLLRLSRSVNVNSAALDMPVLVGRAQVTGG